MTLTRRQAIRSGVGAGIAFASALRDGGRLSAQAQPPAPVAIPQTTPPPGDPRFPKVPTWKTEFRKLAPNVYAYNQGGGPGQVAQGVSNAGVIVGDDHVMVIDATGAPMHAKAFMAAIRQAEPNKPFRRLINTHHHGDHVNGNQFFGNIEIISHPYCRDEVVKAIPATPGKWEKRDGWADGTEDRKLVPPTTTVDGNFAYHYGDTVAEVQFVGPAHTYGDLMVYIPKYKILFASDVAFFHVAPFAHNAHVGKWLSVCDRIQKMDVDVIVPGHGPIATKKELAEMAGYFRLLQAEVKTRRAAGMTPGRAAADIKLGKYDNWIGPERIVMNTVRLFNEFSGTGGPGYDTAGTARATQEYNAILASRSGPAK